MLMSRELSQDLKSRLQFKIKRLYSIVYAILKRFNQCAPQFLKHEVTTAMALQAQTESVLRDLYQSRKEKSQLIDL